MVRQDSAACPDCGGTVDPTDVFCSSCGARCRITESDDEDDVDESRAAFRRRVHAKVAEGWEIEHDEGDSVVLVDRGFGSPGVHVLLFFLTWTFGNALYAAYKYFGDAERTVLRRGHFGLQGTPEADTGPSFKRTGGGLAMLLFGVYLLLGDPGTFTMLAGWWFLVTGAYVLPQVRERLSDRHSLSSFGTIRSTEESVLRDPDVPCSACMGPIGRGVERTYRRERVFAGIPLYTEESGSNHYCRACASGMIRDVSEMDESAEDVEREVE